MPARFTVLGDGAMGTACAVILAKNPDHEVTLWCQFEENCSAMAETRENAKFLPGVSIPAEIKFTADFAQASAADAFVLAIPTIYLRSTLSPLKENWPASPPVVSVIKGIEQETLLTPSEIVQEILGPRNVVVLSGPSHAEEIARGLPASVTAACADEQVARNVQEWFTNDRFRVYTTTDVRGTELAAALKNVIAVAAGISDGLGFGDNAKSALVTRGLVEVVRFGTALGAEHVTFYGLAGIGDLMTTCMSQHSRNRGLGERIGRGETLSQILETTPKVAEGVWTTRSVRELARQKGLEMPVTEEVYQILFEEKEPLRAVADLMARELKPER